MGKKLLKTFYLKIIAVFNFLCIYMFLFHLVVISILSGHIKMFFDYKMLNTHSFIIQIYTIVHIYGTV